MEEIKAAFREGSAEQVIRADAALRRGSIPSFGGSISKIPACSAVMRGWYWFLVVPLVLAAGCIEEPTGSASDKDGAGTPGAEFVTLDASLSGCREIGVARLVSFDHARTLLPAGYEPAEAAEFLGMPTPTGGGVVLAGQLDCAGSALDAGPLTWGDLLAYVHPPNIAGVDAEPGVANLYQLAEWTMGAGTLGLLERTGFEVVEADVSISFPVGPEVPTGSASVTNSSGPLLQLEVAGAIAQPYNLLARFWHETPNGTAYFAHDRTPITMLLGPVISCQAAPGPHYARAFDTTDCTGSESTGGVFAELSDFDSTYHYLPNVWAEPREETV
jgi:hypothetical protein